MATYLAIVGQDCLTGDFAVTILGEMAGEYCFRLTRIETDLTERRCLATIVAVLNTT